MSTINPNTSLQRSNTRQELTSDKIKVSYPGGFFTGLAFIIISFYIFVYILILAIDNITEIQTSTPTVALLNSLEFKDNYLNLTVYLPTYRGDCINDILSADSSSITIQSIKSTYSKIGEIDVCTYSMRLFKAKMFETGDSILFSLNNINSYASDIIIYLAADSAISGEKSIIKQVVNADTGFVLRGNDPSVFIFSIMPAFYKSSGYISSEKSTGFRISSLSVPLVGSQFLPRQIYLNSKLCFKVLLSISETGISVYQQTKNDITTLFGVGIGTITGIITVIGYIMFIYEWIIYVQLNKQKSANVSRFELYVVESRRNSIQHGE